MTIALTTRLDSSGLELAFDSLSKAVRGRIAQRALHEAGRPVVAAIKALAPRKTGLLAESVKIRTPRSDRAGRIAILIQSTTTRKKFASTHPRKTVAAGGASDRYRVYYGTFVEFGHKSTPRKRIAGGRLVSMKNRYGVAFTPPDVPAHEFIRPGFDATVDEAADIIEDKIGEGITKTLA